MGSEEYVALRAEIDRNSQIAQNVFVADTAVTAAILGYALTGQGGPVFLAPFAILIPSLFFLKSQIAATMRIAAYVLVFLEGGETGRMWETRLWKHRSVSANQQDRLYLKSVAFIYGLLGIVCAGLAFLYWKTPLQYYVASVIPLLLVEGIGMAGFVAAASPRSMQSHIDMWTKGQNLES